MKAFAATCTGAFGMLYRADRPGLPPGGDRTGASAVSGSSQRQPAFGQGDRVVGSALIGQPFDDPRYFWSRPSATSPFPYNAAASAGSNLGPHNPTLRADRASAHRSAASSRPWQRRAGTGGPGDCLRQRPRSAHQPRRGDVSSAAGGAARGMDVAVIRKLVAGETEGRLLGFLGEPSVNVLKLNLALDGVE